MWWTISLAVLSGCGDDAARGAPDTGPRAMVDAGDRATDGGGAADSGASSIDGGGGGALDATMAAGDPLPPGRWAVRWAEDFDGTSLDLSRWSTDSDSYSDQCRGNQPDHKLEYNRPENLAIADGILTITARRERYRAPSGITYSWTSGLITTGQNCAPAPPDGVIVRPGDYLQKRARLPADLGMWPALWTWQDEVDVYEFHPDNPTLLELTNHTGETDGTYYDSGRALAGEWHWFGALLGRDAVTWYLDGEEIFRSPRGFESDGAAIIVNLSVVDGEYHPVPVVDESSLEVDSVKVWSPVP
jgi:hypothetical protein